MEKKEQLYEGKAKKVFATDDPDLLIVSYKDDATAFNGLKKGTIAGKGIKKYNTILIQNTRVVGATETEDCRLGRLNSIKISSIKR